MHAVRAKERDDRVDQVRSTAHSVAIQVLTVVVVAPVRKHASYTEELNEFPKARDALCALRDRKLVRHLIAGFVPFPTRSVWLPNEPDGEASLSVYKTYNPGKLNQSFL